MKRRIEISAKKVYAESMSIAELLRQLAEAQALNAKQAERIKELEARIAELEQKLDEAQRSGKRQAAPFSKGTPKANPKKPGRKRGHPSAHRPIPMRITRVLEAPIPTHCLDCGGTVIEDKVQVQYQEDIPRPIETIVTQFNVHVGHCSDCGRRIQGRHPEQISDALGAAAVQLGPNLLGLATDLKHDLGVSYGKAARFLQRNFGMLAQRSAFARADQRLGRGFAPTYADLQQRSRQSEVTHADETGWRVGGHPAWLWVFANDQLSLYTIDPHRDHAVVERILGQEYKGVLITDCFSAYDPLPYKKSKCASHLLNRCKKLIEESGNRYAARFGKQVAALLRGALKLKERKSKMSARGYRVACGRLEAALDRLLARHYSQTDNKRFAKLLRKQRAYLFTFLYVDAVSPTNNLAERELRPAVIIRKTNGCNRSPKGATAHAILSSVIRTARKNDLDFVDLTKQLLQHPEPVVMTICASDPSPPACSVGPSTHFAHTRYASFSHA